MPTASMQRDAAMLEPWLRRMEPLILVGPEGAGKNLLLSKLFAGQRGTQVAVVHCSASEIPISRDLGSPSATAGGGGALLGADALDARDTQALAGLFGAIIRGHWGSLCKSIH